MDPSQILVNGAFSIAAFLAAWQFRTFSDRIKDCETAHATIAKEIQALEVQVAGKCVTREELQKSLDAIFGLLRDIDNKLAGKADRQ